MYEKRLLEDGEELMKINKLAVCAVAFVSFGLVGCGVEGTYKLDKAETKKAMEADIAKMPADQQEFAKKFGLAMADKMDATLELKKDNSMSMSMTMEGKSDSKDKTGTWKKEGDDVVLTADGKDLHCSKSGKKLTCIDKHASGDTTMVFTKS